MITPRKYSTAKAFRVALEARLKQIANSEHILPNNINPPPVNWRLAFEKMAGDCNVNIDIDEAFRLLEDFFKSLKNV